MATPIIPNLSWTRWFLEATPREAARRSSAWMTSLLWPGDTEAQRKILPFVLVEPL